MFFAKVQGIKTNTNKPNCIVQSSIISLNDGDQIEISRSLFLLLLSLLRSSMIQKSIILEIQVHIDVCRFSSSLSSSPLRWLILFSRAIDKYLNKVHLLYTQRRVEDQENNEKKTVKGILIQID